MLIDNKWNYWANSDSLISEEGYCTKEIRSRIEMMKKELYGEKEIVYW